MLPTFQVVEDFALPAATALFSLRFTAPLPIIVGCWPLGVELPATVRYVATVCDNLLHSTQDVCVH